MQTKQLPGREMHSPAEPERRQHPRTVIHFEIRLTCHNDSPLGSAVPVHDISLVGMAIYASGLPLKIGDRLCLCLSDRQGECSREHLIEATVVNLHDNLAGIRFDSVGVHILKDIQKLLRDERAF